MDYASPERLLRVDLGDRTVESEPIPESGSESTSTIRDSGPGISKPPSARRAVRASIELTGFDRRKTAVRQVDSGQDICSRRCYQYSA